MPLNKPVHYIVQRVLGVRHFFRYNRIYRVSYILFSYSLLFCISLLFFQFSLKFKFVPRLFLISPRLVLRSLRRHSPPKQNLPLLFSFNEYIAIFSCNNRLAGGSLYFQFYRSEKPKSSELNVKQVSHRLFSFKSSVSFVAGGRAVLYYFTFKV